MIHFSCMQDECFSIYLLGKVKWWFNCLGFCSLMYRVWLVAMCAYIIPQQHEHDPQQEELLPTPAEPWREAPGFSLLWFHTKVVVCLLSEGLVQVWVFWNPVVNHSPTSGLALYVVMKMQWVSLAVLRGRLYYRLPRNVILILLSGQYIPWRQISL